MQVGLHTHTCCWHSPVVGRNPRVGDTCSIWLNHLSVLLSFRSLVFTLSSNSSSIRKFHVLDPKPKRCFEAGRRMHTWCSTFEYCTSLKKQYFFLVYKVLMQAKGSYVFKLRRCPHIPMPLLSSCCVKRILDEFQESCSFHCPRYRRHTHGGDEYWGLL